MNTLQNRLADNREFTKALLLIALPMMGQELLNTGVNLLDSVMVGQLSLGAVNGVGFANQIFFLLNVVMFGVNSGSAIFIGQYWGKKDPDSIRKVMGIAFSLNMAVAAVFGLCAFLMPQVLIGFFTRDPASLAEGVRYIRIIAITYFIVAVTSCFNSALRSIGQPRFPMFTTLISLLCSGVLNYIFIFHLGWGVAGSATGTTIARVVELIAQQLLIRRYRLPVLGPLKEYFTATKAYLRDFFKLVLPVILNEAIWALGVSMYPVVYQLCGTEAQGAVQITSVVQNLFMVAGFGISAGCGVLLANLLGAGERERAIAWSRKCLWLVTALGAVMCVLLLAVSPLILSFYHVSGAVKDSARVVMYVVALGVIIKTFNCTSIVGVLRSGGDTRYCLFLDLVSVWGIAVPLILFGAAVLRLPIHWVVALAYSEEVFKVYFSARRVRSNVWANCVV